MNRQFDLQWDGTGGSNAICNFTLNFGDGKSWDGEIGGAWLPAKSRQVHTYTASGPYTASIVITSSTFGACSLGAGVTSLSFTIP